MTHIPEIETRPIAEIAAFQDGELRKLMAYLKERSPFYKRHFIAHGVDTGRIFEFTSA